MELAVSLSEGDGRNEQSHQRRRRGAEGVRRMGEVRRRADVDIRLLHHGYRGWDSFERE